MIVKDLDGNNHRWALTGHYACGKMNKSDLHIKTRELLVKKFPTLQVLEEVPVHVTKSDVLYLDFYLPLKKVCIEVQGEQHFKFVAFYHQTTLGFVKSQKRDRQKKEWCEINDIKYIELAYNNQDEWENIIGNN
jgi:uncharacterized UPF0160 family protein